MGSTLTTVFFTLHSQVETLASLLWKGGSYGEGHAGKETVVALPDSVRCIF